MSREYDASMLLKSMLGMSRQLKRVMNTINMDPQLNISTISVIFQLERHSMKMNDIADYLNITLGAATSLVDKLERRQLVERIRSVEDRRIIYVQLTDAGREKLTALRNRVFSEAGVIFKQTSAEEMEQYVETINRITQHLCEYNGGSDKSCLND